LKKIYFLDIIKWPHLEEEDSNENKKGSWDVFDEGSWLPSNPPCVQESNHEKEEDLKVMEEEDIQDDPKNQVDQGHHNYIEIWFQTIIKL